MQKSLGELGGIWSLVFKITQVMWAISLPIILAIFIQWGPWVTHSTILNNDFRETIPEAIQKQLTQSRAEIMVWHHQDLESTLKDIKDDQKTLLKEVMELKQRMPPKGP